MKPPALADWVLRVLVPRGVARDVLGDLHEEFSRFQLERLGAVRSKLWYWNQALGVLIRYGRIRFPLPGRIDPAIGDSYPDTPSLTVGLLADLRSALRRLAVSPGHALISVATLALGIGVTSVVFSAVNGVLLKPLPYAEPDELVTVEGLLLGPHGGLAGISPLEYRAFKDQAESLRDMAASWPTAANLSGEPGPASLAAVLITPNLFPLLGVTPALGRGFTPEDVAPEMGVGYVAVLSHAAWEGRFGSDPDILGRELVIDEDLITVVGVMPEGFRHPGPEMTPVDLWGPMDLSDGGRFDRSGIRDLVLTARLRQDATVQESREEAARIAEAQRLEHPGHYPPEAEWTASVTPLMDSTVGGAREIILLLFGSVGLVLLAVVTNVAGLQLMRGTIRTGEFAVRAAIGGSRARITRQLLAESLLLGIIGGIGGLGLAFSGTWALRTMVSLKFPRMEHIEIDGTVLLFTLGTSVLSVVAFGLLPALRFSRTSPRQVMDQRNGNGASRFTLPRKFFVGIQTAVAVVLFVSAGLLVKSYDALGNVDLGFDPENVLHLATWLPVPNDPAGGTYADPVRRIGFFDEALQGMARLPEVTHAALTSRIPLEGAMRTPVEVEGTLPPADGSLSLSEVRIVSEGYFDALGIDLIRGRTFEALDGLGSPEVAIVDQAFVDRFLPGIDPVGRRIHPTNTPSWLEIVGVVRNVRQGPLRFPSEPTIYRSFRQNRVIMAAMSFLLKTGDRPAAHAEAAAGVVREVDPDLPTYSVFPMDRVVANARRQERLLMVLFGIFSGLTGILAALGVYGVVGSAVTRRSREIGIRLALGGAKPGILRMLLGEGMRTGILGILFGLVLALGLSRLLSSFLFEVQPGDAGIATGSVALAVLIVTLSSLFPALDATRIDPAQSVKAD